MTRAQKYEYDHDWYYHKNKVREISEAEFEKLYNAGEMVWTKTNCWRDPLALRRSEGYPDRDWQTQKKWTDERISYLNFYA